MPEGPDPPGQRSRRRRSGDHDNRFRRADTARLETFSDGVFAIAVTILVLDLASPPHPPGQLAHALAVRWPAYLGFVASFGYVGVIWVNHHQLFARVRTVDRGLHAVNLALLATTAALAFPTSVVSDALASGTSPADARTSVALYAGVAMAMCASWLALYSYLRLRPRLVDPHVESRYVWHGQLRSAAGLACYALAGLLGYVVSPIAALVVFVVMPVFYFLTTEGLTHL